MLKQNFTAVYSKFKLQFYRSVFDLVRERDGSLSAMEAFSLEVISMLGEPTVGKFADFLSISQSNATYKVNSLIKKGYIEKLNSTTDRREYYLKLTDKYYKYSNLMNDYQLDVIERIEKRFSPEDVEKFDEMLKIIASELMPEISI
ncbi:MAG: MarR family transcriptional regulator [Oscillospiraceae bacterium]|nr:MarR family transcriptional regulator [Oscillospiraceae bacterium]